MVTDCSSFALIVFQCGDSTRFPIWSGEGLQVGLGGVGWGRGEWIIPKWTELLLSPRPHPHNHHALCHPASRFLTGCGISSTINELPGKEVWGSRCEACSWTFYEIPEAHIISILAVILSSFKDSGQDIKQKNQLAAYKNNKQDLHCISDKSLSVSWSAMIWIDAGKEQDHNKKWRGHCDNNVYPGNGSWIKKSCGNQVIYP